LAELFVYCLTRCDLLETVHYDLIEPMRQEARVMVTDSRPKDCRIRKVVQTLNADPLHTVPELAHNYQISASRLSHLFKNEVGVNVKDYRLDCRLQRSAEMLVSTNMLIKEIAYLAGYGHSSSFVRAFKTHFGVSPASYRRRRVAA
jgi:transcriptional regulator GlxA family with amidase domain